MAWGIQWNGCPVQYSYGGDVYNLDHIRSSNHEFFDECGDSVMIETYQADSEHGSFLWKVSARCSELDSSGEIESTELLTQPNGCESDLPVFSICNS